MEYKQSMNLVSPSGYAMPFELSETTPLEITLGYGKQTHPVTGKEFFHHGVDFKVYPHTWLKALATGVVSGIASDREKGFNITIMQQEAPLSMMWSIHISRNPFAILAKA